MGSKTAPGGAATEIMRIDGDGQSLLMADTKKLEFRDTETYMHSTEANILALVAPSLNITSTSGVTLDTDNHFQFRDAATYVASSASNVLDIVSPRLVLSQSSTAAGRVDIGTGEANKIESDATSMTLTSPNLTLNGTTKTIAVGEVEFQDSLIFANNGSEVNELVIAETGTDDYTITNMVQDKDIIFNLKPGGTPTEIARFDGSATSFRMAATNKLEFTDGDDYINNEDSKLNIVSKNSGNVKIGNIGADEANTTNRVEIHALNTIEPNTDEILVTAPDETPKVTLSSVKDDITLMPQLHFKKIRGGATGINNDLLGEIAAIGEDDGDTETVYAKIQFKSTAVADAAERGSIQFITDGATGPFDDSEQGVEDLLMDINHSTENAVTVHADLKVEGAMSLNGAAFRADITSDLVGENSLGTDGLGEWKSLNLYDAAGSGSMITFGVGSDNDTDLRLTYNGTDGLTLNRDNKLLFNTVNAYINSSADRTLDLVAVTDGVSVGKVAISDGGTSAKMTFAGDNNFISAADVSTLALVSPTLNIGNTSSNTYVLGELELQDSLILADNGSNANEFVIAETGTDHYTLSNMKQNKDIILNVSVDGAATDVAKVVGSTGSLQMQDEQKLEFKLETNYISSNSDGGVLTIGSV